MPGSCKIPGIADPVLQGFKFRIMKFDDRTALFTDHVIMMPLDNFIDLFIIDAANGFDQTRLLNGLERTVNGSPGNTLFSSRTVPDQILNPEMSFLFQDQRKDFHALRRNVQALDVKIICQLPVFGRLVQSIIPFLQSQQCADLVYSKSTEPGNTKRIEHKEKSPFFGTAFPEKDGNRSDTGDVKQYEDHK